MRCTTDVRAEQFARVIARAHAAVSDDDVDLADVKARLRQLTPQARQHRAQVFVERVGVQSVGEDELHLRAARAVERGDARSVFRAQSLARGGSERYCSLSRAAVRARRWRGRHP